MVSTDDLVKNFEKVIMENVTNAVDKIVKLHEQERKRLMSQHYDDIDKVNAKYYTLIEKQVKAPITFITFVHEYMSGEMQHFFLNNSIEDINEYNGGDINEENFLTSLLMLSNEAEEFGFYVGLDEIKQHMEDIRKIDADIF